MTILQSPRCQLLTLLAALSIACVSWAQPESNEHTVCGGRLRLTAPQGWQVTPAGDAGAVLRPPVPDGQPIEIVGWDVPRGGEASPLAAATAQETLLIRTGPYARRSVNKYKTAAGKEGLLLSGQVRSASGTLEEAAFAAFCEGGRYYIIGTFVGEGRQPALESPFAQVLKTLQFQPAPAVAAAPARPAEPGPVAATVPERPKPTVKPLAGQPAPTIVAAGPEPPTVSLPPPMAVVSAPALEASATAKPATPHDGAAGLTVAAPALPPAVGDPNHPATAIETATFTTFESPIGFKLEHPTGWKTSVVGGRIEVIAPPGDGSAMPGAMVIIWPLTGVTEKQDAVEFARKVLRRWDAVGVKAAILKGRMEGDVAILAGKIGPDEAQRRLIAACHVSGDTALLSAMLMRPEELTQTLPALVRILASFTAGPWWTGEPRATGTTVWRDTVTGSFETIIPAGWKARGGVQNYNGSWSLYLDLSSDDARNLSVTWQQPVTPAFRDLTLVLRNLGWQEGDKYVANPGDQPLRLLTRLSPQDFLTRYWLAEGPLRLQEAVIDGMESSSDAAALLIGTNPAGIRATLHGKNTDGRRERLCLLATADGPARLGASCWQAAVLQAEGPEGQLAEAVDVLRSVIAQARPTPDGPPAMKTPVYQLIAGAKLALSALPEPQDAGGVARDVLPGLKTSGAGQLWLLSPEALQIWQSEMRRLQADDPQRETALLELQPAFWQ